MNYNQKSTYLYFQTRLIHSTFWNCVYLQSLDSFSKVKRCSEKTWQRKDKIFKNTRQASFFFGGEIQIRLLSSFFLKKILLCWKSRYKSGLKKSISPFSTVHFLHTDFIDVQNTKTNWESCYVSSVVFWQCFGKVFFGGKTKFKICYLKEKWTSKENIYFTFFKQHTT